MVDLDPGPGQTLVLTRSGQCGAFVGLLLAALAVNGIHADRYEVSALDPDENLLIRNFIFWAPSYPSSNPVRWFLSTDEMVPVPPGDLYGDLQTVDGAAGQNSSRPSEKGFVRHYIVKVRPVPGEGYTPTEFYDPSYGLIYADEADFESQAIEGYYEMFASDSTLRVRVPSATVGIEFLFDGSN
jgi:hypothetical protein